MDGYVMWTVKDLGRNLKPPILWRVLLGMNRPVDSPIAAPAKQYGALGEFSSFQDALSACGDSYHNSAVQEKTRALTASIVSSPAISPLNIRLLAAIQFAMIRTSGNVEILDFGGAMGAHYFYLRSFLASISKWTVIEIEETVAIGRQFFADGILNFEERITGDPSIVISSGAIQYTPLPYDVLDSLLSTGAKYVILDKVPLKDRDRIAVQHVHPSVFGVDVSFPVHFFDQERFRNAFAPYKIVMEWEMPGYAAHIDNEFLDIYRGFVLSR